LAQSTASQVFVFATIFSPKNRFTFAGQLLWNNFQLKVDTDFAEKCDKTKNEGMEAMKSIADDVLIVHSFPKSKGGQ